MKLSCVNIKQSERNRWPLSPDTASCPDFGLAGTEDFLIKQNSKQLKLRCSGIPCHAVILFVKDQSMTDCVWAGILISEGGWPTWLALHFLAFICWCAATQKTETGIVLLKMAKLLDCLLLQKQARQMLTMEWWLKKLHIKKHRNMQHHVFAATAAGAWTDK